MKHYALLGEKLGHSLSVPIHMEIFRRFGIEADYRLLELPRETFAQDAARLLTELDGFNVTIPYKRDIIPLLRSIDPAAEAIGAVNTVHAASGCGYNTDVMGFTGMLRHYGIDPADQPCYVLGGGGTSLTACAALRRMGARSVTVVSRHPAPGQIGYDRLLQEFSGVLVNTTPAGMLYQKDPCPVDPAYLPELLRRATGVVDVIYNPPETLLTAAAHRSGVPACTGLYMLVEQAVEAERIWQGIDFPADLTPTLMKELKLP